MENNTRHDSNPEFTRPEEPELDLYTIPRHSTKFLVD
ncbi:SWI/SNF complex subunit SWI3A-like protein [Corchorus olitorius]|uniref:SWI/SNF complex subunit SWI3A-like protein n=1 Tax=Corchorus olitorius TaxID=93759 RepID=A0A1R3HJ79_9ROSI|nr:SWI/SNF complex subunit SWI3A-like protein [Corchorus olitorius]